jgi:hypothetical protein
MITDGSKHVAIFSAIYIHKKQARAFCRFRVVNRESIVKICPAGMYYILCVFKMQNLLNLSYVHTNSGAGTAYGDWLLAGRYQVRIPLLIPSILALGPTQPPFRWVSGL